MLESILRQHIPYKRQLSRKSLIFFAFLTYVALLMVVLYIVVSLSVLVSISGSSMEGTYSDGDIVLINRYLNNPKVNDIAVIELDEETIIKRVVAVGGQVVQFRSSGNEVLFFKGESVESLEVVKEDYVNQSMSLSFFVRYKIPLNKAIVIPHGEVFVMGDNRNDSLDSRMLGSFSTSKVKGIVYLKLDKGGLLEYIFKFVYNI